MSIEVYQQCMLVPINKIIEPCFFPHTGNETEISYFNLADYRQYKLNPQLLWWNCSFQSIFMNIAPLILWTLFFILLSNMGLPSVHDIKLYYQQHTQWSDNLQWNECKIEKRKGHTGNSNNLNELKQSKIQVAAMLVMPETVGTSPMLVVEMESYTMKTWHLSNTEPGCAWSGQTSTESSSGGMGLGSFLSTLPPA